MTTTRNEITVTDEQREVLEEIAAIFDEGLSGDGWDIGILEWVDQYLRDRGVVTQDVDDPR